MTTPTPFLTRWLRRLAWLAVVALVLLAGVLNVIAYQHARAITNYAPVDARSTRLREIQTWQDKARLLLAGPEIRRMENRHTPGERQLPYRTVTFPGGHQFQLEAWRIDGAPARPTVLLFPGYGASKDTLLGATAEFHALGCETWLIDFAGIGGSEGRTNTIGWGEAEDVAAAFHQVRATRPGPVVLYGTSMGAVSILGAVHRGLIAPDALILECPFDDLSATLGNRLRLAGLPSAPLAQLMAFWIGAQHGFDGLAHNPVNYARSVRCPTLLLQGENDQLVGQPAARRMARALGERGTLQLLPGCGHAWLVRDANREWRTQVTRFLDRYPTPVAASALR